MDRLCREPGARGIGDGAGAGQSALLVGLLPGELLAHGNAALQTLREGLRLLAPLAGAGLFAWLGGGAVAALDAATFLAAAAALALMRLREPRPRGATRSRRGELDAGIAHVRATPVLRRLIAAGALAVAALGLSEAVLFAVVDDGLHRAPAFLGVLLAVQGAGAVAAGASAPAVMARAGERGGCALGMALAAAGLPLLATSSLALVLAGAIVFGVGLSWIVVGAVTLLQRSTPADLQGRAYAVLEMALAIPQTAAVAVGARSSASSTTACCSWRWQRSWASPAPSSGHEEGDREHDVARRAAARPRTTSTRPRW